MLSIKQDEFMFELKYRPTTIEECILPLADKEIFRGLVKKGKIPHLVLQSNSPGTGKTTVALALCHDVNAEYMFVNGSDCKIDFVRNDLTRFASASSIAGRPRIIVIDEFDRSGLAESQRHLRTFMEVYGKNCSIIMTANNLEGIIQPLRSRARVIQFGNPTKADTVQMMKDMIQRSVLICKNEQIEVKDLKVIAALVKKNFPDFRKTINELDHYGTNKVIDEGILSVVLNTRDSVDDVLDAMKSKDFKTLRTLCTKYAADYSAFIEKLSNSIYAQVSKKSKIRMYEIIGENNQTFNLAANPEIHLMYLFVQLTLEMEWV